jgi:hypothetical protein
MDPLAAAVLSVALGGLAGAAVSGGLTWSVGRGQREHERERAKEARRQATEVAGHLFAVERDFNVTLRLTSSRFDRLSA